MNSPDTGKHSIPILTMIRSFVGKLILATLLTLSAFGIQAAGFTPLEIPDAGSRHLNVGVWYPSDNSVPTTPNSPFNQSLALDGTINVEAASLVVLSHGFGGWLGGHADTALALANAGFVVAAPSHTGNTFKDMSSSPSKWLIDRPRHVSITIDYLTEHWDKKSALGDGKVGVFGFSAGGQTALSLIGAIPDITLAQKYCESQPEEFVCREGLVQEMLAAKMGELPDTAWGADVRIGAAAIAAPGLGIAYNKQGLAAVQSPVQLWSGLIDDRVPHESNSQPIADALGRLSENHWIENAGHFAFMVQSCTEKLKQFEPETWDFLCVDKEGFDRKAFHEQMNAEIARFFEMHL